MSTHFVDLNDLAELKLISGLFDLESNLKKIEILKRLETKKIRNPRLMLKYQEILLFLAAHPGSLEMLRLAEKELERLNLVSSQIMKTGSENQKISLSGTGFASSYLIGCFSHAMNTWLERRFPDCTAFHSYGESEFTPQQLIGFSLLPSESWLLENLDLSLKKWQALANGSKNKNMLRWILKSMEQSELPLPVRDLLYDSLQLYISFDILEMQNSASLLRSPKGDFFFNKEALVKKFNAAGLLNKKLPLKLLLSSIETDEYIRISRLALLHLSRETDPVTYVQPEGLEVYTLDRGLSIALFYLPPERRNALDAYIGYMIYKNRIPCGYGGAWVFGNKAKVGLNIFPSFRGGESAFIFTQILRTYKQRFHLRYFEAEPYQIGKDNPEGISSGAFWFYYKLGFRPHQPELLKLADMEYDKISSDKKYKTPAQTLKTLANSMMFLDTKKPGQSMKTILPDSLKISRQISNLIATKFNGDRITALTYFRKELRKNSGLHDGLFKGKFETSMFGMLLPLLYFLCTQTKVTKKESNQLAALIRSKAGMTEFEYTQHSLVLQSIVIKAMKEIPSLPA